MADSLPAAAQSATPLREVMGSNAAQTYDLPAKKYRCDPHGHRHRYDAVDGTFGRHGRYRMAVSAAAAMVGVSLGWGEDEESGVTSSSCPSYISKF